MIVGGLSYILRVSDHILFISQEIVERRLVRYHIMHKGLD